MSGMRWAFAFIGVWLSVHCSEAYLPPASRFGHGTKSSTASVGSSCTSNDGDGDGVGHRREFLQHVATVALGTTIINPVKPAFAERTLSTVSESYKRYVPRMEIGFKFLVSDLKDMISDGRSQEVIAELTAEKGTKISAMKGTMRIFATAFSDSVVSQTTRELQLATLKTSNELDNVVQSLQNGDTEKALEAQRQSVFFAQVYSELANSAIPRSLEPICGPQGVGKRLTERDNSITGGF